MASDNLLERAFMARIRADEYREALAALQQEFDEVDPRTVRDTIEAREV